MIVENPTGFYPTSRFEAEGAKTRAFQLVISQNSLVKHFLFLTNCTNNFGKLKLNT